MTFEMDGNTQAGGSPNKVAPAMVKVVRNGQSKLDKQLAVAQLAIGGAANDPEIMALTSPYGFGVERVTQEGQALLAQVKERMMEQSVAAGAKLGATDECDRVYQEVVRNYTQDRGLALVVLRGDRSALGKLGLHEPRKSSRGACLAQARRFYTVALGTPELQMRLAQAGITQDRLEGGRGLVAQVDHSVLAQTAARSAAQQATRRRDEAMGRLDKWMAAFRAVARLALSDRPELLSKLGIR